MNACPVIVCSPSHFDNNFVSVVDCIKMDTDFDRYFQQGQKLGYSEGTLQKYIDQCLERDQRETERDKEREREREERLTKLKLDAELEKERLKAETERIKIQQEQTVDDRPNSSHGLGPRPSNFPKLPTFKESVDSIDAFLYRFEAHANALKWPKDSWSVPFSAVLEGQVLGL